MYSLIYYCGFEGLTHWLIVFFINYLISGIYCVYINCFHNFALIGFSLLACQVTFCRVYITFVLYFFVIYVFFGGKVDEDAWFCEDN